MEIMKTSTIAEIEKEIVDEFALFDEWTEKYEYIIDLGKKLPSLDPEYKTDLLKIKGCQSSVWLHSFEKGGLIFFEADSDSTFVKGEIAFLIRVLSGQSAEDIIAADLGFIDAIGLRQHLAMTRANGLAAMIRQMKYYALAFQTRQKA